ncbi:hypothetical protein MA16_Dca001883 [Dendrobium catenatum]|uniref:Uncharacterized protein n=1 Tax=Dendrobium catenatum TaxID=906689 RepID=A0A2I0XDR9_9ASPA|nr:hypothetical protein MA16_Dca001883 [Dendrobium catenatum]
MTTAQSSSSPPPTVVPNGKTRSFKDVLARSSSASSNLKFVQTSFKGCPALMFDDSVVSMLAAPFSLTMHGHNMAECFKLHPNLKKERVKLKADSVPAVNVIPTIRNNEDQHLSEDGNRDCDLVLHEHDKDTVMDTNGDISLEVVLPIEKMPDIHNENTTSFSGKSVFLRMLNCQVAW